MRAEGWVGRRERVEGGQVRMGSAVVVVLGAGLVDLVVGDEGGRGCCWMGRVRSVVMRLRRVRRGEVGIGWGCLGEEGG